MLFKLAGLLVFAAGVAWRGPVIDVLAAAGASPGCRTNPLLAALDEALDGSASAAEKLGQAERAPARALVGIGKGTHHRQQAKARAFARGSAGSNGWRPGAARCGCGVDDRSRAAHLRVGAGQGEHNATPELAGCHAGVLARLLGQHRLECWSIEEVSEIKGFYPPCRYTGEYSGANRLLPRSRAA